MAPLIKHRDISRRTFLKGISWAPALFVAAPLQGVRLPSAFFESAGERCSAPGFSDVRIQPKYPTRSPLDDVLRYVAPGSDDYVSEKCAFEITQLLDDWARELKRNPPGLTALSNILDESLQASTLVATQETSIRSQYGIEVFRRVFSKIPVAGRAAFIAAMTKFLSAMSSVETAEFQNVGIEQGTGTVRTRVRYELVGSLKTGGREQHIGEWLTEWQLDEANRWRAIRWEAREESVSRALAPMFVDVSSRALGKTESYRSQFLHGVDHWRTVLDGACGIDVYGNNGIAVGDFDNDGFDDLYICQPAGLPNRLYRNRGDGTFEDVTHKTGVDVLDNTSCALFADFENKGVQDLLVVCGSGPLLFLNDGKGKYSLKGNAFKFAQLPQGSFTHAAIADYDRDGRLDVYFCAYNYYLGLEQYRYPVPYFDARNGPPNFLFHNDGDASFRDVTKAARLNVDNDRYSFACAWGDSNSNGWPDLYVANDFGRSNLYRNNGDGTFTAVSAQAHADDPGAGMSACWCDFDNDGRQEIYVANMWSAAGIRVSEQNRFHEKDPEKIRAQYRRHARGNSLYRNRGDGTFENISEQAGVEMGRFAWCSDAWDYDHDGHSDLYIANGYISAPENQDVSSFFWRHVVAQSPANSIRSPNYERGWNAINELIRSDHSWNGTERNVFFLNNGNGTFSDVSAVVELDFPEDGRAFALLDLDHDGRLEVVLKNRNAPQLRLLRNTMKEIGHAIAFRLKGTKSNRDAIGTSITVEAGTFRQTKYLQAGSGFLAQHTKELFFGLGNSEGPIRASVRWPSGLTQTFENLPIDHRVEIEECTASFTAKAFAASSSGYGEGVDSRGKELPPASTETWLVEPLRAPDFSLPDIAGRTVSLESLRGRFALLSFWSLASPGSVEQIRYLGKQTSALSSAGLQLLAINVDNQRDSADIEAIGKALPFLTLLGTDAVVGIYNILYRYLFDLRRDLPIPVSLLIDPEGMIVKVYQGPANPEGVLDDVRSVPRRPEERISKALPFPGKIYLETFQRNEFTYGVALFHRGYLDEAAVSFKQVIADKPKEPEAYYNLGTLYLRTDNIADARTYLDEAVKLRPDYPEAWNNLGMLTAQQGQADEAERNFQRSLALRPDYATALLNLGNLYRRQRAFADAEKALSRALELEPEDPEANYSVGMLYAQENQLERAADYLQRAITLRPDYPDALNNLGVLLVRKQRYRDAEQKFQDCIRIAPNFDQGYLNLARLYVVLKDTGRAKHVLQSLLQRQPQNKIAQQTLEMLQ